MIARLGTLAGAAAVAVIGLATPAAATPQDSVFLDRLQKVGITSSNPYATVYDAYAVCRALDRGTSHTQIVGFVMSDNPDLDWDSAADYVVLANMTYCPPA